MKASSSSPAPKASVTVVTYNLLSPELCNPKGFPKTDPKYLDSEYRRRKIFKKLHEDMERGAILCLQEVSRSSMASELKVWLNYQGYDMISAYYGTPWNGYMGEVIAYPRNKHTLIEMDVKNISETIKRPFIRTTKWDKYFDTFISWLFWFAYILSAPFKLSSKVQDYKRKYYFDDYVEACKRYNCVVMARLTHYKSTETFWVANYHMPCMFKNPGVMILHTEHVVEYVQSKAGHIPFILTGDWNFQPDSNMYELITKGQTFSLSRHDCISKMKKTIISSPLKSAHYEHFGEEPVYTARSFTSFGDGLFQGAIDYIFMSHDWDVYSVDRVCNLESFLHTVPTYPNKDEPSDHLKLSATLYIRPFKDDSIQSD